MYTLVTKKEIIRYIVAILFTLIFGQVYELFSHNVYSNYMIYAFTIPLIGLIALILLLIFKVKSDKLSRTIIAISLETLTIGSLIKGILEIYGTTNFLISIYFIVGFFILVVGIIKLCVDACTKE